MPGQTPKYRLPYPVSSDPLNQGAIEIMNLANRLETILNSAGIAVPAALAEYPPDPEVADDGQ